MYIKFIRKNVTAVHTIGAIDEYPLYIDCATLLDIGETIDQSHEQCFCIKLRSVSCEIVCVCWCLAVLLYNQPCYTNISLSFIDFFSTSSQNCV